MKRFVGMRVSALAVGFSLLAGCVTTTVVRVDETEAKVAETEVPEELLLDVGINVFDLGVPDNVKKAEKNNIVPGVRRAEARIIPSVIKTTLQQTKQWGATRVIPGDNRAVHVQINGEIVASNGEELELEIVATDATGRVWIDKRYADRASRYSYAPEYAHQDPFQNLYNELANDLLAVRKGLSNDDILEIRRVTDLRFAADLAPDAFAGNLAVDDKGRYSVLRLPAEGDPMTDRVQRIMQREYMFIDTLDEHYVNFYQSIDPAYDDWRKYSYQETLALKEIRKSATMLKIFGGAIMLGGVMVDRQNESYATEAAADAMLFLGAVAVKSGFDRSSESKIHAAALRELGDSFEAEVAPMVVDVEGQTVELKGSVDEQYAEWRRLLREMYTTETGFAAGSAAGADSGVSP